MNLPTTLVTGSSSGIGLYLAHQFAEHGHPVVLVAPVLSELETIASDLTSKYGVEVRCIAKDLEQPESAQEIFDELARDGIQIGILANNAGHGHRGKSWDIAIEQDLSMIRLNIEAVLRLTKLFLPPMLARDQGRILNTASVAGFEPGPFLNVYHATKAFVLSWSEALAIELKETGIRVTALCPGPTDTDFFPKAHMEAVVGFQKAHVMAPQDVAKAAYEGLMREELFVVPGVANKALVALRRLLPETTQAKMNEKMYEEVPPEDRKRKRGDIESQATAKA